MLTVPQVVMSIRFSWQARREQSLASEMRISACLLIQRIQELQQFLNGQDFLE